MRALKVMLVSSEAAPFSKTGGLADVSGSLPIALKSIGCDVKVFLPYYRETKAKDFGIRLYKKNLKVKFGDINDIFSLYHCEKDKVDFYFIEKDNLYSRDFLYGTSQGDYPDNAIRFGFFVNAVLAGVTAMDFKPDIIHCNDWQTALIPFYIRHGFKDTNFFKNVKTLFTIHNLAYQGLFPQEAMQQLGIGHEFFTPDALEFYGKFSFIKSGIIYSDAVSTVSRGYAKEILTEEFGCGLSGLLNTRKENLYGIINGVDYVNWNPATDNFIKAKYSEKDLANKELCKKDLLGIMKLTPSMDKPLLGVITRLAEQKGIDIIAGAMEGIIRLGASIIILGSGDKKYHDLLTELSKKYPKNLAVAIAFDNALAHKIEAGSDMFLMPSRFEPCGLNQMYSLKYGTIPVVRAVGGLDDTIIDYSKDKKKGNGFKFKDANTSDFLGALKKAVSLYNNKKEWQNLMVRGMKLDFSWENSANEYMKIFELMKKKP